jgi:hypothetical protein
VHVPVDRPVDVERLVIKEKAVEIEKVFFYSYLGFKKSIVTIRIAGYNEAGSSPISSRAGLAFKNCGIAAMVLVLLVLDSILALLLKSFGQVVVKESIQEVPVEKVGILHKTTH